MNGIINIPDTLPPSKVKKIIEQSLMEEFNHVAVVTWIDVNIKEGENIFSVKADNANIFIEVGMLANMMFAILEGEQEKKNLIKPKLKAIRTGVETSLN